MSRSGMRRSRESLQSYPHGNDGDEDDVQQQDDESQYDEDADEGDNDGHSEEDGEEEEDEEEEEEDNEEANESVEQREDGEDEEQYAENEEDDEDGLNDTKELEASSQPLTAAAPFSATSTRNTAPSSITPLSFTPSAASISSFSAFPASSSTSLSAATKPAPFGSAATSGTPFSFSAGLSSSSAAPGSSFSFAPVASTSASSSSSSSFSLPSFAFPSTSSSTSTAPLASSFSFPSLPQPAATPAAAAPLSRPSAASTTSSTTSTSVSTTAAGTTIYVPLSTSCISAVWSTHDDILFYPTKPNPPASAASRNNQSAASNLSLFRWPPIYGETSTLLHAWHAVFTSTQRQAAERAVSRQRAESMEWRLAVLSQSHCYRAELEACLYRAVQSLSSTAVASELKRAGVSESEYHSHLRVLESVSSTWHLFELLYLDPHDNLTVQLTDWMQRSYLAPSLDGLVVDSDEWWEAVLGLLVQGRLAAVEDALHAAEGELLQFVSADVWQQLLELIETLPSLTAHATSVSQLVSLVRDYRLAVQRLASSSAALMSHPFLPYLLAVLAGDEQAIATICPTWMQLLVARLIFNQPHTTKADIPQLVTQCIQQLDDKDKADSTAAATAEQRAAEGGKALDALREHVLCFRIHAAVVLADQMFDLPYFTAHLVDLLHHAALMPTLQQDDTNDKGKVGKRNNAIAAQQQPTAAAADKLSWMTPRDYYVQQYVQSIIAHERLWTLTPEYVQSLTTPAVRPVQALCTLFMRQPCSSYAQLRRLQSMAARLQLPAVVGQQLALRLAHHLLRMGEMGSAVAVYQRSGEEGKERVRQIARKLLFSLIQGKGEADSATGELTTAMECVLDNVSEEWLDEERGSVDLLLLQHWSDYTAIARQLHSPAPYTKQPLPPQLTNVFQSDQSGLPLPPAELAAVAMDGVEAEGEVVAGLLQDGVTLLVSLLTAPLIVPSVGSAVVYTAQCFHLPLLVRLCALLQRVEAGRVGCELSASSVRDVLHALSRCELSWQWEEWKAEIEISDAEVDGMRRTLLSWLQQTSTAEESAKRVSVRV